MHLLKQKIRKLPNHGMQNIWDLTRTSGERHLLFAKMKILMKKVIYAVESFQRRYRLFPAIRKGVYDQLPGRKSEELVKLLREEGVTICDEISSYDYGKFVHIMDADGNKIELWEPIDEVF